MYFMILYSMYMFVGGFIMISGSLVSYYYVEDYLIEWVIFSWNSASVEIFILLDWIACLFISFVLIISFSVILYSSAYMMGDKYMKRFLYLVVMFIVSMIMMIISPSLLSILFGWDLLGLISYCLVIYYQSASSFNSGMVTVLTNRIGDVGLLMCIGLLMMNGSWNWFLVNDSMYMLVGMILLASITKSAQMPFSSWLPMAMAAPTPVSSLVHSSTLVTAGVYLILRFNDYMMIGLSKILLLVAVSTMMMSGIMAIFECDLKKVVALSTLSQLGLMMMTLSLGLKMMGFFHLLTHAVFKSLLFLCAGGVIHGAKDTQDIRLYGNMSGSLPFVSVGFYISVMALTGVPFLAGFYSKDLIMESLYMLDVNLLMMYMILFSLSMTVIYSFRLCSYMYFGFVKIWFNNMVESSVMNFSMMILMVLSLGSGGALSWLFFYDQEIIFISYVNKMLVLMIFSISLIFSGMIFCYKGLGMGGGVNSVYVGSFSVMVKKGILFFSKMWMLNFVHLSFNEVSFYYSENSSKSDLEWIEMIEGKVIFYLKYMLMKFYLMDYKLYKVLMVQGGIFIFLVVYFML